VIAKHAVSVATSMVITTLVDTRPTETDILVRTSRPNPVEITVAVVGYY